MKKNVILPALALAGGVAGFFLRRWQLASAYQPETGLFVRGAPATIALLGLTSLLALVFLFLLREKTEGTEDFLPAFGCPSPGQMAVLATAFAVFLVAGGFSMQMGFQGLRLWQAMPQQYQLSIPASQLLAGGLAVIAGFAVLHMGRMAYWGELNSAACFLSSFPALAGLVWMFSTHLQNGSEPVLMKYGFELFAALLLTLAHYYIAGFLFGKPHVRRTAFLSLMGIVLGVTSLADGVELFAAAFSLSALGFVYALLAAPWPERMPPAEEEERDN